MLVVVLLWASVYSYVPYQAVHLRSLGTGSILLGFVLSAYGIPQLILRIPLGMYVDRIRQEKKIMLIGMGMPFLASLIRLVFNTPYAFLLANLCSGMGAATWVIFIVDFSNRRPDKSLQNSMALINSANQAGILLAYLASLAFYPITGMPGLLFISMSAAVLGFILVASLRKTPQVEGREAELESGLENRSHKILKKPQVWQYAVFGFLQIGLVHATVQAFSLQHVKNLGGSDLQIGLMNVVFMATSVVASVFAGTQTLRRMGARKVLPFVHLLMAVYCFLVPLLKTVNLLLLLQLVAGVYAGMVAPFAVAEATKGIALRYYNTAVGVYQAGVGLGITIMPALTGTLIAKLELTRTYFVLAILSLLVAIYAIALNRTNRLTIIR